MLKANKTLLRHPVHEDKEFLLKLRNDIAQYGTVAPLSEPGDLVLMDFLTLLYIHQVLIYQKGLVGVCNLGTLALKILAESVLIGQAVSPMVHNSKIFILS